MSLALKLLGGVVPIIKPRPIGEIWEWAEASCTLSSKVTPFAGPLRFDRTPYMRGEWSPFWAYLRFRIVTVVWPAQTGKTLQLQVMVAYNADNQPGPMMVAYADEKSCKKRSKRHIRPFLVEAIPHQLTGYADDLGLFEIILRTCSIAMGWSGSSASLASEPVKYLFSDEIGKWQKGDEDEGDPQDLAIRRTVFFGDFARIYQCTTPSKAHRAGWRDLVQGTFCQLHVPCPYCGERQVMFFGEVDHKMLWPDHDTPERGGLKWQTLETIEESAETAYYECQYCAQPWSDRDVDTAVQSCRWKPRFPDRAQYSCHMVSWVSPQVKLRDVVGRWLRAGNNERKRREVLNSDLAVCDVPQQVEVSEDQVREHVLPGHSRGVIPAETVALILTADIMDDHFRYRIRAHSHDHTSWGVEEGVVYPDFKSLDALMARTWPDQFGRHWRCLAMIDSGWRTQEVYRFCVRHSDRARPLKGDPKLRETWKATMATVTPEPRDGVYEHHRIPLAIYHHDQYRDALVESMAIPPHSPGAWHLEEDVTDEYCRQMTAEAKVVIEDEEGNTREEWTTLRRMNHAWDCEVYQIVARDVYQVAAAAPATPEAPAADAEEINPFTNRPESNPYE